MLQSVACSPEETPSIRSAAAACNMVLLQACSACVLPPACMLLALRTLTTSRGGARTTYDSMTARSLSPPKPTQPVMPSWQQNASQQSSPGSDCASWCSPPAQCCQLRSGAAGSCKAQANLQALSPNETTRLDLLRQQPACTCHLPRVVPTWVLLPCPASPPKAGASCQ